MTQQIPLSRGLVAVVDEEDFQWLNQWRWHVTSEGYAARKRLGACILMHRVVADAVPGVNVDHANGQRLDNRRRNLRVCSQAENVQNAALRSDSSTGFKGVSRHSSGLYRARVHDQGAEVLIGYFSDPESAARAYDAKASALYGEFARLNFPAEWARKKLSDLRGAK